MIAPFWDDIRLTNTGIVKYGIVASVSAPSVINEVEGFLKQKENVDLELDWVFVAKWVNVCSFLNINCSQVNWFLYLQDYNYIYIFITEQYIPGYGCISRVNILCCVYI